MAKSNIYSTYGLGDESTPKGRVVIELQELEAKLKSLREFISKPNLRDFVSNEMVILLGEQANVMQEYTDILKKRLEIWDLQN